MREANTDFVDGRLYSLDYNDFYAAENAVEECRRVHVLPAKFADRMRATQCFTVFELGLGAGINFLTVADTFLRNADPNGRLRYFSCEAHPLPPRVLARVVKETASGLSLYRDWIDQYPPPLSGIHRRLFADQRIELSMMYGSANHAVEDFLDRDHQGTDAWILDGFAPDRNAAMWKRDVLGQLALRSKVGATVTTYSVAGHVRRTLSQHGFRVTKIPSLPYKRHTTLGELANRSYSPAVVPSSAIVVGGGFSGCSAARALARRGWEVELQTPSGRVADGTSSIPTAIVHARLSASDDALPKFRVASYTYSLPLLSKMEDVLKCGALQFPNLRMPSNRLSAVAELLGSEWVRRVADDDIETLAGVSIEGEGYYFPKSIAVRGPSICAEFVDHSNINVIARTRRESTNVQLPLVFATGSHKPIEHLIPTLEIALLEGQVDEFGGPNHQHIPEIALLRDGYVAPSRDGLAAGSTYEYTPWPPGEATATNLRRIVDLTGKSNWQHRNSFRSTRAVTSDRLPVAGQIGSNVWVNLGHGSSGTTSAPLCSEIVASLIAQELPPVSRPLIESVHPKRFELRQQKRPNPFLNPRGRIRQKFK